VAELLLKEGADLRAKDSDRLTPIYQVCSFSLASVVLCVCVCVLYERLPTTTHRHRPRRYFGQASFFGHDQIVKLLLQYYTPEQNVKKKKKAVKEPTACDNIQVRLPARIYIS
jgi:hypothetical protein